MFQLILYTSLRVSPCLMLHAYGLPCRLAPSLKLPTGQFSGARPSIAYWLLPLIVLIEEIIPLVICQDKCRHVFHDYFSDSLHAQLLKGDHLH